eukprot:COSAG05_NODE_4174_length_1640_cov_1.292667_2_plen_336_part_00
MGQNTDGQGGGALQSHTAFSMACEKGRLKCVQALVRAGCNTRLLHKHLVNVREGVDLAGQCSGRDMAEMQGHTAVAAWLDHHHHQIDVGRASRQIHQQQQQQQQQQHSTITTTTATTATATTATITATTATTATGTAMVNKLLGDGDESGGGGSGGRLLSSMVPVGVASSLSAHESESIRSWPSLWDELGFTQDYGASLMAWIHSTWVGDERRPNHTGGSPPPPTSASTAATRPMVVGLALHSSPTAMVEGDAEGEGSEEESHPGSWFVTKYLLGRASHNQHQEQQQQQQQQPRDRWTRAFMLLALETLLSAHYCYFCCCYYYYYYYYKSINQSP